MDEHQLKILLAAAEQLQLNPDTLQVKNPFLMDGKTAQSIQTAVSAIDPAQAARWRVEAGQSMSLGAAAAKAGLAQMTNRTHEELIQLDPDYLAGAQEAAAVREQKILADMEAEVVKLRERREKLSRAAEQRDRDRLRLRG